MNLMQNQMRKLRKVSEDFTPYVFTTGKSVSEMYMFYSAQFINYFAFSTPVVVPAFSGPPFSAHIHSRLFPGH